jgi:type II secretory pathway pseudopilin PulG
MTRMNRLKRISNIIHLLLTVIALAVIIALIIPAISEIPGHRNPNSRAENTAFNLKNAISAFFVEYREYPLRSSGLDITADTRRELMDILLAAKNKQSESRNPRAIAFYTDKAAKPMENGRFQKGIRLESDGGGELWDTWGNHYRVRMDTDFDNQTESPESPGTLLPESILIWSAGKDGKFETWKDNVKTW